MKTPKVRKKKKKKSKRKKKKKMRLRHVKKESTYGTYKNEGT